MLKKRDNASKNIMLSDQAFIDISTNNDSLKEKAHLPADKSSKNIMLSDQPFINISRNNNLMLNDQEFNNISKIKDSLKEKFHLPTDTSYGDSSNPSSRIKSSNDDISRRTSRYEGYHIRNFILKSNERPKKCSGCLHRLTGREDILIYKKYVKKTRKKLKCNKSSGIEQFQQILNELNNNTKFSSSDSNNSDKQKGNLSRGDLKVNFTNSKLRDKYMLRDLSSSNTEKRLWKYALSSEGQKKMLTGASPSKIPTSLISERHKKVTRVASGSKIPSSLVSETQKKVLRGASELFSISRTEKMAAKARRDLSPLSARPDNGVTSPPITDGAVVSTDKIVPRFSAANIADINSHFSHAHFSYETRKRASDNADNKSDLSVSVSPNHNIKINYSNKEKKIVYENSHFRKKRSKWESDDSVKNKHTILEKSKAEPPGGKLEPVGGWYDVRATTSLEATNFQLDSEQYSSSDPEDPFLLERELLLECELWLPGTDFSSKQSTLYIPGR